MQATAPQHLPPNLTVEGTGTPRACVSAIRELFNFSSCKGRGDCAFNGVYQPPVRGQFYVSPWGPMPGGPRTLGSWGLCTRCGAGWRLALPQHRDTYPAPPQAFSSCYYTFHFLNLTSGQPLATANATIWEFCQKTWRQVGGPRGPQLV